MNVVNFIRSEARFAFRERSLWLWLFIVFSLSSVSVIFGVAEVERQQQTIQTLLEEDQKERLATIDKVKDWGSAAYYNFHLTYDPPSDFAYAALGMRDSQPWKHRIRMLALEGQIYESDVGNPSVALMGRFDFAFFTAFIVPLILIMMLYDIKLSEKTAGRLTLIEATLGNTRLFWFTRVSLRTAGIFVSLIVPLCIAGIWSGTAMNTLFLACVAVFLYLTLWMIVCLFVANWQKPSLVILMVLIGIWTFTAVLVPAGARLAINKVTPLPESADILLLQRESVNDAWDLPREETMHAFFKRHPEWAHYEKQGESFEWPWYYAFQQVGDQQAESLSLDYREGKKKTRPHGGMVIVYDASDPV
jgi:ABC-2 type transport system permease protein